MAGSVDVHVDHVVAQRGRVGEDGLAERALRGVGVGAAPATPGRLLGRVPALLEDEVDDGAAIKVILITLTVKLHCIVGIVTSVARWQNLMPSFPWIAPGWRAWGPNPRKERV